MVNIPEKITPPINRSTVMSLNKRYDAPINKRNVMSLNNRTGSANTAPRTPSAPSVPPQRQTSPSAAPAPAPVRDLAFPHLMNPLRKGQKSALDAQGRGLHRIEAHFGWNIRDSRCDLDASAFLVGKNGRVPADEWFVFYGQEESPDRSVRFAVDGSGREREIITIDLDRLSPAIVKIVLVLTINEAFENSLNFSMIKEAYVRIIDPSTGRELVSYRPEEYYAAVTSMTIGEVYLHNGAWKFNPVGNGVKMDLADQCAVYGVAIC